MRQENAGDGATARPWAVAMEVNEKDKADCFVLWGNVPMSNFKPQVATVWGQTSEINRSNSEYIEIAVNQHDSLLLRVKALEAALKEVVDGFVPNGCHLNPKIVAKCAALALASKAVAK